LNGWREWWRIRRNIQEQNENAIQQEQVKIEMERVINTDLLEEKLERVYFKLVELNGKNKRRTAKKFIQN
jgi:hypothetical protein